MLDEIIWLLEKFVLLLIIFIFKYRHPQGSSWDMLINFCLVVILKLLLEVSDEEHDRMVFFIQLLLNPEEYLLYSLGHIFNRLVLLAVIFLNNAYQEVRSLVVATKAVKDVLLEEQTGSLVGVHALLSHTL